ncbi:MAG TPA: CDP-alcohol phosphatidyltransferase family protein [Spirochaetales bacterium]|nr:CDP-alcohol phosphatidyltransferase family protein [Spirochaetales bacterium]
MREKYYDPDRPLNYKYQSVNKSILDNYVLNHWWPVAIKAIPPNASANLVSIVGSLFCWACFLVLAGAFTGPLHLVARSRPWLFGLAALFLFLYQTLDSLDGIQARRTGASGPLGEYIDHWFDSINAYILPLGIALAFPAVPPQMAAVSLFLVASAGWLSGRAVRDKGVMLFGPVSGEEVLSLTYLFLLSVWALGYDFWATPGPLGFAPVVLFYALVPLLLAFASISSAASVSGFSEYALAMASCLPPLAWTLLSLPAQGRTALILGGLLICFTGARFAGDVLRDRLVGLEYQAILPDVLFVDACVLFAALSPGLPPGSSAAAASVACLWMGACLVQQFGRTAARVREVTGVSVFRPAPLPGEPPRRGLFQRPMPRPALQRSFFARRWR